jgi:hypothetical protein
VESNPVRAKLVERAEDWKWSSLTRPYATDGICLVDPSPVTRPEPWLDFVNESPVR